MVVFVVMSESDPAPYGWEENHFEDVSYSEEDAKSCCDDNTLLGEVRYFYFKSELK